VYYKIVPTTSTYISLFDFSQFVFYERRPSHESTGPYAFLLQSGQFVFYGRWAAGEKAGAMGFLLADGAKEKGL
jgi:hypothetical protein